NVSTSNHAGTANLSLGGADLTISSLVQNGSISMATGVGVMALANANNTQSLTTVTAGEVSIANDGALGPVSSPLTLNGAGLQITGTSDTAFNASRTLNLIGATTFDITNASNNYSIPFAITPPGSVTKTGAGA